MNAPVFQHERLIRFSDCDPAGIVFYPQYFVMFNALVEDWLTEGLGVDYHELIGRRRVGLPTVRLEVDFKNISRMGDRVTMSLRIERLGERSITLALSCEGASGDIRLTVRQVLVTTSLESHKAIEIPADLRTAIGARAMTKATAPAR